MKIGVLYSRKRIEEKLITAALDDRQGGLGTH